MDNEVMGEMRRGSLTWLRPVEARSQGVGSFDFILHVRGCTWRILHRSNDKICDLPPCQQGQDRTGLVGGQGVLGKAGDGGADKDCWRGGWSHEGPRGRN